MLRKLFRHEIRSLSRYFIPMYIIVLLLSPLIGLMVRFNQAGITARSVTLSTRAGQTLASLVPTFSMVGYILLYPMSVCLWTLDALWGFLAPTEVARPLL